MARFIQPPQQQIVSMYTPENVEFYANLLNKAQSDLERATAIKQAAIDKMGDLPFFTKEDRDATLGRVQQILSNSLDDDFISPSKVTSAVMQANSEVMPGIHALKAKAKAAETYEKMQLAYGPNAWLNADPRQQSIVDPATGRFVDPNKFKAVGINAEEVDKLLLASQQQELNYSYDEPTKSDLPGYLKVNKYTGLSDLKREELYKPGSASAIAIAKSQLATMPQLREVFGSEEAALTRLMERNYQTTGNYKQTVDSQYLTDRNYIDADTRARLSAGSGGASTSVFKPVEGDVTTTDVTNDLLKSFVGNSDVSSSDMEFNKDGRLVQKNLAEDVAVTNQYGQVVGYTPASSKRKADAMRRNTAMNKAITAMRKSLQDSGLSIVQDSKTGKMRARTDKEVFDFYNQAATNSANTFGRNFEINPGLGIIGANSFFEPDGSRKDFRNANVEIDMNDGKGWRAIDESKFAEELGFDISNGKEKMEYINTLKSLGSGIYDFMGGSAKIRTATTNNKGEEISIRYNASPEVSAYKKPVVELYSAFTKPIPLNKDGRGKIIQVGNDSSTGKPVYVEVVSDFTVDNSGKPIIAPKVIGISQDTESGKAYAQIYATYGYNGLLETVQTSTDEALISSDNIYTKKAVNLKEVPNGE